MKGDATCHTTNAAYRAGWERAFVRDLMCSRCTLIQRGAVGDPCPDRLSCLEDGPDPAAILVATVEEADRWCAEQSETTA